ncbi:HNH endonuclease [Craterilacuibacter sinensis]|uniref:HNH nuclease domain-containing protein n=1 Tax=Craterilacuibacter sinensis TaxID=2686017 RepID=A0A845BPB2_9NEIS|nr:HNH endonuclease signature motif containing protein [Craterilacuibacter sinensis]MXR36116.1 hypothetical protein [Craterilacuibacter sinensis]
MADIVYYWKNLEDDLIAGRIGYLQGDKTSLKKHSEDRFSEYIWIVRKSNDQLWLLGKLKITNKKPKNFPEKNKKDHIYYDASESFFFRDVSFVSDCVKDELSKATERMRKSNFRGSGSEDVLEPKFEVDLIAKTKDAEKICLNDFLRLFEKDEVQMPPYRRAINRREAISIKDHDGTCAVLRLKNSSGNAIDYSSQNIKLKDSGEELLVANLGDAVSAIDVDECRREIDKVFLNLEGQDIDAVVKRRVGQGIFRKLLLKYFGGVCCVTGLSNMSLLIASHIVPWSKSEPDQKLCPDNGLLLSVSMDALFDKGLISFSNEGDLLLSKELDIATIEVLGLERNFSLSTGLLTERRVKNLAIHRKNNGFD